MPTNDQTDAELFQSTETISDQLSTHKQLFDAANTDKPDTQLVSTESPTKAFTFDTVISYFNFSNYLQNFFQLG